MATDLSNRMLLFRVIAGMVAAAIGPLLWYGTYDYLGAVWMAPLLIGLIVGMAVRSVGGPARDLRPAVAACVLTVLGCAAGYILTDQTLVWVEQPTLGQSIRHLLSDLTAVVLIALGTYLSYLLTGPRLPG